MFGVFQSPVSMRIVTMRRERCGVLLLLLLVGCGTGEYERRLGERNAKIQAKAALKFNVLAAPLELPGTGVSIAVPKSLADPPLAENADPRRLKPPTLAIPGQKLTYEGFVQDSEGGQLSYYCYLGVTPGSLQEVVGEVQKEAMGNQRRRGGLAWTDFEGEQRDGLMNKWRKVRIDKEQEFYYKPKNGQEQFPAMPGALEIYLYDAGGQVVVMAWRLPTSIEKNVGLASLMPLVAGSVSVKK
jgi:hypothetical protein